MASEQVQPSIICENSVGIQRLTDENGVTKNVHVVAKTLPFVMLVSFPMSLPQCKIEANLFYDGASLSDLKMVPNAMGDVMTSNVFIDETGSRATVECKINALTSQHRSHFRVRVQASLISKSETQLKIFSSSIMTVSKHSQATKQLQKNKPVAASPKPPSSKALAEMTSWPSTTPSVASSVTPSLAPSTSDPVLKALQRLEKRQLEQQKQLEQITRAGGMIVIPDPQEIDFEEAFRRLVETYNRIPAEDRPNKLRKISTLEPFGDFLEICNSAMLVVTENLEPEYVLEQDLFSDVRSDERENFYTEIDGMYSEIFSSPETSPHM